MTENWGVKHANLSCIERRSFAASNIILLNYWPDTNCFFFSLSSLSVPTNLNIIEVIASFIKMSRVLTRKRKSCCLARSIARSESPCNTTCFRLVDTFLLDESDWLTVLRRHWLTTFAGLFKSAKVEQKSFFSGLYWTLRFSADIY